MTIDKLVKMRKRWVEANRENDFEDGIKNLLTDLYPDNAHFTYELLQNAEDAGASKVQFDLNTDRLEFEHNGDRLFDIEDITAITSIGVSTKRDEPTSIGKFGIGFKAVFAYTATPEIESGPFHFRIRDMVVPDTAGLARGSLGDKRTRFVFPFDNSEKSSEKARAEIETKLRQLNENTLLFLSNIRRIEYRLSDSTTGSLERRESKNDESQIEIAVTRPGNIVPDSTHYLRFQREVDVRDEDTGELKRCQIAVAFGIDRPRSQNGKIVSLNPGQVCIYFPAESETSKLRFHLHAPFASTVARASVRRDSAANEKLRDHLADLVAESIGTIRDQGLLDVKFLATLPNSSDDLSPFYLPIQKRLIEEFNKEKLTPTRWQDVHVPASELYHDQSDGELSGLIQDEDLAVLLGKDDSFPLWVANLPPRRRNERGQFVQDENARRQNERINDFLTMLDISEWPIEDFIEVLGEQPNLVVGWLKKKSDSWHQKLYVFLGDSDYSCLDLRIVRCSDGKYRIGKECHFPSDNDMEPTQDFLADATGFVEGIQLPHNREDEHTENFHYVVKDVYFSGRSNDDEKAHKFLEDIGVCEVDEAERIKLILRERYKDQINPRDGDMEKFIDLVKDQPEKRSLFKDYFIFEVDLEQDDKRWFSKPSAVFVDSPYLDTGLTAYHAVLSENSDSFKRALSPNYTESGIDSKRFGEFAEAVGAQTKLTAEKQRIPVDHPEHWDLVDMADGQWRYGTGRNEDYIIPEVRVLLDAPSIEKSKLIWQTMRFLPEHYLQARFWNNNKFGNRAPGKSSLVHELRNAKWVPQINGNTESFVRPCDASVEDLPEGFLYETGRKWLNAIELGRTYREQSAEYAQRNQQAKSLGFDSSEKAEKYAKLDRILGEQGISPDDVISQYSSQSSEGKPDFPTSSVKNPELRKERVLEQISNAPEKAYEERERRERHTKREIDQRTSLIEWYTNDSGEMICQICKEEMPFKKTDDEYYFVAVEALTIRFKDDELPENHFPKEYEVQYLALCPECAARYDYFARTAQGSEKLMKKLRNQLMNLDDLEVPVCLGELETSIRFVQTHLHDLKVVLHDDTNPHDALDSDD